MRTKQVIYEDFVNYKQPCMFIGVAECDGKCYNELGRDSTMCINSDLAEAPTIYVDIDELIKLYIDDPYTDAIVFGGLEPMLQIDEIDEFINIFRYVYMRNDPIIIYTGYYKKEIYEELEKLSSYPNIIVKFGRYIPDRPSRYDDVLGVVLASDNQYAEQIS